MPSDSSHCAIATLFWCSLRRRYSCILVSTQASLEKDWRAFNKAIKCSNEMALRKSGRPFLFWQGSLWATLCMYCVKCRLKPNEYWIKQFLWPLINLCQRLSFFSSLYNQISTDQGDLLRHCQELKANWAEGNCKQPWEEKKMEENGEEQ